MNFSRLFRTALECMESEDELHLAFLLGHTLDSNEFLRNRRTRFSSVIMNAVVFFYKTFRCVSLRGLCKKKKSQYVVFISSLNQLRALETTIEAIEKEGHSYSIVYLSHGLPNTLRSKHNFEAFSCNVIQLVLILALFCLKSPALYFRLRKQDNYKQLAKYFGEFCSAYLYLPSFLAILSEKRPNYVLVSNDHSVSNRCFIRAARNLNIRTVFMQHGSGGGVLPPLEFDFAFLNGHTSLKKYVRSNESSHKFNRAYKISNTTVFLSGIKKRQFQSKIDNNKFLVGVAINPFDNIDLVCDFVKCIAKKDIDVVIRAHPSQEKSDFDRIYREAENESNISLSNFYSESSRDFISRISILVAGRSSILEEMALSGKPPYFFDFNRGDTEIDLYGHIEGGIAREFPKDYAIISADGIVSLGCNADENTANIKNMSETFLSEWHHREGELVVKTLLAIDRGNISKIYKNEVSCFGFKAVYGLFS